MHKSLQFDKNFKLTFTWVYTVIHCVNIDSIYEYIDRGF